MKAMMRGALLGGLLLAGASGCNTYKYIEVHTSFDPATGLDSAQTGLISQCWITVSGADSDHFRLTKGCPKPVDPNQPPLDLGVFEFATFADSGSLTFKFDGYAGVAQMARCTIATGTVMVPVTGETTIPATLKVGKSATPPDADCSAVTMPGGM